MSTTEAVAAKRMVRIPAGLGLLDGELTAPVQARGLVIFACERDPRMLLDLGGVASELELHGFATLLFDFLGVLDEPHDGVNFDGGNVELFAHRLVAATVWAEREEETASLPIGYFGSGVGSAVALLAAMTRPRLVRAIVSGGGRPDLAATSLHRVEAATLLIIEGNDISAIRAGGDVLEHLGGIKKMCVIPGASRSFGESGASEALTRLATEWFTLYLGDAPSSVGSTHKREVHYMKGSSAA